jgi:hypothetical protein
LLSFYFYISVGVLGAMKDARRGSLLTGRLGVLGVLKEEKEMKLSYWGFLVSWKREAKKLACLLKA